MAKQHWGKSSAPEDVRRRAEELVRKTRTEIASLPPEDVQGLVYELQVHQAELEIQNEELCRAQVQLQEAQDVLEARVLARTQSLQESESRLKAIVDTAADAIITIDKAGCITSFNAAAERMFGYSASEVAGKNINMLMPSPYREEHDRYLSRYLQSGVAHIIGVGREVSGRRKDGSTFPVDLAVSEIGELRMFTGILRDLSERKALHRQILDIATAEQRRIGQDLHDGVGQELTGISLMADTLATLLRKNAVPEADLAARITRGVQEALDRVRTLSRGLIPVDVDAEGLMRALAELAGRVREETGVECHFSFAGVVLVRDNEVATHLYRIAQEAVANALRHGRPKHLEIKLEVRDEHLVLTVTDDGKGIERPGGKPKGMGLQIMDYRARLLGGTLTVEPAPKGGTLVRCRLRKEQ
jgi:PAS domain S-box-containing protein